MADAFELEIINRKETKTIRVEWVAIESPSGNFVVGPDHYPLISLLKDRGTLTYKEFSGSEQSIDTYGGLLKVDETKATIIIG